MRSKRTGLFIQWISGGLLLLAILLAAIQLILFSRSRATYPSGLEIGEVPVANLSREQAANRLLEVYTLPIELKYEDQAILLDPAIIGFELNMESMLAAADLTRTGGAFWTEYWQYLMGNQRQPNPVPLDSTYSESLLRNYLETEISPRYDKPPSAPQPIPGSVDFVPGLPGTSIDLNLAVFQIENALQSPTNRSVAIPLVRTTSSRPSIQNLEILLKQTIEIGGFDGTAGVYLFDLQTSEELHFLVRNNEPIPTQPDLSFSAASVIKIPILISAYRHLDEPTDSEALNLIRGMIEESGNDPADWLMENYIDSNRGPLEVTKDIQALGLENTFLAGHFRPGSVLLYLYDTPGNTRADALTDLDVYSQTTISDMGSLLIDIYQCAEQNGGALIAVFPNEISSQECQAIIGTLLRNNTPFLIEAGAPDGTPIAHKHGWITDLDGAITTIGDAGIVYTPTGNYVLVIYFNHPVQLVWDPISSLISDLARTIYNYYNLPNQ